MLVSPLRIFAALVVATVAGVSAQDACIIGCLQQSLSPSTCTSYTNISCVCSNKAFQSASAACINANCTTADQQAALELQLAECGSGSTSGSGASSTSTPASSSTPTSSNGAVHDQVPFLNGAIALATVALGGAFIL
ncbi:hypothetical protein EDB89DRAFT_2126207 [Lactarius sanguifluus]|nr:hypothetical protein EDB89DRAFT_2077364 [Lactarius sanguifluus]KAH9167118.1 hypothetical protein EDB89DRAFT_2126207 [Lactarius sanguifluus]